MKYFLTLSFLFILQILNAQIISVPYNDQDGFPIIKVKVDGKEYDFLFDTGAQVSALNSTAFKNQKIIDSKTLGDISRIIKNVDIAQSSIEIDKIGFNNLKMVYMDLSAMDSVLCHNNLDGIIGRDIMKNYSIEINTDQKKINFYEKLSDVNLSGYKKIKLPNTEEPKVLLKIGNQKRYVLIDTGSNGKLVISDYKLDKLFDKEKYSVFLSQGSSTGAHGRVQAIKKQYYLSNINFKMGNLELENQQLVASDFDDNNLGFTFLKQFNIILNLNDNSLYVIEGKQNAVNIVPSFAFVSNYHRETGDWVISKIKLEVKNLHLGDIIYEINGEKLPPDALPCNNKMEDFFELQKEIKNITVIRNKEKIKINF
ncbi:MULTISPECIES: aspartyl protease family protein [Chryseobacterium]|jgi:predicted aspartyl protease|uniref:Gag-polyprotein putative aspartyl protease n=1 Tax=Chryseobacterium balustinum TaxID=246 RepID=A0AAX2ILD8_9FLAO|nr:MULTISPECIES: aspartyl protease family protein [Chryseobacterium]AZB31651.1 hypothetical protein EB354_21605 [Chryseobacterium balustinum]MDY0933229.1 aspartyl protease family protein [Chryseobacterium sp. CFBP8996]SKB81581.1 gag-polyprotein putative aspartyl protease [Chryseobacterium balustinum]SQA89915.1 Predicted aspartyl protease [Chryseobacterium balustinum]